MHFMPRLQPCTPTISIGPCPPTVAGLHAVRILHKSLKVREDTSGDGERVLLPQPRHRPEAVQPSPPGPSPSAGPIRG